jgi:hypothetical protein
VDAEIVSASRRTDVPAFHARWFLNRIRAGFCHWIHPYTARVRRVSLLPADVLGIVFWTRNPRPLLPHLDALRADGYPMAFQLTITGYGPPVESHNPPVDTAIDAAGGIAARLGPEAVLWRYDPIVLSRALPWRAHVERFARLARRLEGVTRRCTFSFVDFYGKTERNLGKIEVATGEPFERPDAAAKREMARELAGIAAARGMSFLSCCDDALVGEGVGKSRCVDPAVVAAVRGGPLPPLPFRPTREDCGCVRSVDVGAYDTCAFGCAYCYAVSSRGAALRRLAAADPEDTVLWRPPSLAGVDLEAISALDASARPN